MPNGKPGDHPLTDILVHNWKVYSTTADDLIREIVNLGGRKEIEDMLFMKYNVHSNPDIPSLERVLSKIRDRLRTQARKRGWET